MKSPQDMENTASPSASLVEVPIRQLQIGVPHGTLRLRSALEAAERRAASRFLSGYFGDICRICRTKCVLDRVIAAGDKGARKNVDVILAKAGVTIEEVTARTLEKKIDVFEKIDRMLASV
jgi:hypothetical protein